MNNTAKLHTFACCLWVLFLAPCPLLFGAASAYQNGMDALAKRDYATAIQAFNEAVRDDPKNVKAYCGLGLSHRNNEDYDKAVVAYSEAIRIDSKNEEAHRMRGCILSYYKGEHDKAIADLTESLRLRLNDPSDPSHLKAVPSYAERGKIFAAKGDHRKAVDDFDKAIQSYEEGNAAYHKRDPILYALRGKAYSDQGEYKKALKDLNKAIEIEANLGEPYLERGVTYVRSGSYDLAIADFTKALGLGGIEPPYDVIQKRWIYGTINYQRGRAYEFKKDYASALQDYSVATKLKKPYPPACISAAWLLATCPNDSLRDGKKAVELATQACDLTQHKDPKALQALAAALAEAGDFDQAVQWQKKYLSMPGLAPQAIKEGREHGSLYVAHKPYHAIK